MNEKKHYIMIMRPFENPEIHKAECKDVIKKRIGAIRVANLRAKSIEWVLNKCIEVYGDAKGYDILPCTK